MTIKLALTVPEAAAACSVTEDAIRTAIRRGQLKAKRQTRRQNGESAGEGFGKILIPVQALEDYISELADA